MASFDERVYWNANSYGSALRIPKNALRGAFAALCVVTPATNWLLPFTRRLFRDDVVLRY